MQICMPFTECRVAYRLENLLDLEIRVNLKVVLDVREIFSRVIQKLH